MKRTGTDAASARYNAKQERQGLKKNSFWYPANDDELVKEFMRMLRDTNGQRRDEIESLLHGWAGK